MVENWLAVSGPKFVPYVDRISSTASDEPLRIIVESNLWQDLKPVRTGYRVKLNAEYIRPRHKSLPSQRARSVLEVFLWLHRYPCYEFQVKIRHGAKSISVDCSYEQSEFGKTGVTGSSSPIARPNSKETPQVYKS
jgi:hypothetical protein